MKNTINFKPSFKKNILKCYQKLYDQYYQRVHEAKEAHNKAFPDDQWIYHGTYLRVIKIWDKEKEEWVSFAIKILRIRCKHRTFSFQGGLMLLRTQYCGLMMLQAHAERILNGQGKHPGTSEAWGDLPETTACRVERLLNTFVGTKKLWSLVTKIGSSEGFVDYFMKKLWPSKGNPFCSGMEADTSAFLKDYASYVF